MSGDLPFSEQVLSAPVAGSCLHGILCLPAAAASDVAVLIVVGGPQYRVGSHRQFVQLARALAAAGVPSYRFDVRGMGDSEGDPPNFEHSADDIAAAADAVCAVPGVGRLVMWGLCDGASAALLYLQERPDPRVAGVCLANPWVRSAQSQVRTQVRHYYRDRLRQREFWAKLLSGRVGWSAVGALVRALRNLSRRHSDDGTDRAQAGFQDRMAAALSAFGGPVLLLLSGRDYTAREFVDHCAGDPHWQRLLLGEQVTRIDVADADHTFSADAARVAVESATTDWLALVPRPQPPPPEPGSNIPVAPATARDAGQGKRRPIR